MGCKKLDNAPRIALKLVAMLLLVCVWMAVGTALARYRYRDTSNLIFTQKTASEVYLWGGIQEDGSFIAMPADLTAGENGQELSFLVSNGVSQEIFSQYTQQARLRLFCTLGLGAGENLSAELTVGETVYSATAMQIDVQSPLYETFGEGWAYCFLDEDGNELFWELEGGQLSFTQMKLTVNAAEGLDTSLLQLMVTTQAQ